MNAVRAQPTSYGFPNLPCSCAQSRALCFPELSQAAAGRGGLPAGQKGARTLPSSGVTGQQGLS